MNIHVKATHSSGNLSFDPRGINASPVQITDLPLSCLKIKALAVFYLLSKGKKEQLVVNIRGKSAIMGMHRIFMY